jgi:small subunit ribosomal protein S18
VAKRRQPPPRLKGPDKGKFRKPKVSPLVKEGISYVDYKDVALLRTFMSERAKVRARRVTGNDAQQQREVARAIKNAREMALLPYANRVVTQRRGDKKRGPRGEDGYDDDGGGAGPRVGDTVPAPVEVDEEEAE